MRTNHVLIDFESVQPATLAGLDAEHFRVLVFVGAGQAKVPFDTAAALQRLGARAEYLKISGNGPNALDFHIAFHIGRLSAQDPAAYFHIISKDTGFDPLIQHLKDRKIGAARWKDVTDIPLLKLANSHTLDEKVGAVVVNLRQRGASKPRALNTLHGTIQSLFQKQLSEKDMTDIVGKLVADGLVVLSGTKVSYNLPAQGGRD